MECFSHLSVKDNKKELILGHIYMQKYLVILFLTLTLPLQAQQTKQQRDLQEMIPDVLPPAKGGLMGFKVEMGDTVYFDKLAPVYVFDRPNPWTKRKQWRDYYKTVYNFKKVYPYALLAKRIILEADSTITNSNFTRRERDKYVKQYEKRLFKEFEKPLKHLSFSQGRLLLKLIDREVGQTSFYIIKGYKGILTAGFWQFVAKIFGSDLKKPYDKYGEDKVVEELVKMYYNGSFNSLYYSMFRE